jgi:hypothetical protein
LSEITQADRAMALKLLKALRSHIAWQNRVTVSNDNDKTSFETPKPAGTGGYFLSPAIEAAAEIIAAAREEGRNARQHELLALEDRDFILISRQEYNRLNSR